MLLVLLAFAAAPVLAAPNGRDPYLGYLYPAGARAGTAVSVLSAGQALQGAREVYVSGAGVHATVTGVEGPLGPLNRMQLDELQRQVKLVRDARFTQRAGTTTPVDTGKPTVALPDLPELRNLNQMNLWQLKQVADKFLLAARNRAKPPLAERVTMQITVDADAAPGERELRVRTSAGLSNPVVFEVGSAPEVLEREPNGRLDPAQAALDLPVVLNGQIAPGDADCYRLRARKGQKLVIEAEARRLIPYLADAVPGWFQAALTLYDAQGQQVAFAGNYEFNPDPVLFYEAPAEGEYVLEIRDALYRGRDDFVYRVAAGEQPFVTSVFPLGGREGVPTTATIRGWNLPATQVQLDTTPGGDALRSVRWRWGAALSNRLPYAVDTLPEVTATEANHAAPTAQPVILPVIVNGRIGAPGAADFFRLEGRAGEEVVAEVSARRLGSPLDSLLRLTDATGKVLAWNDDQPDPEAGLLTHHADSYLRLRLPATGTYYVQMSDAQHHGGEDYAYRLRLSAPRPDFALRMTPASLSGEAGRPALLTVHAFRKDGWDGDIDLALAEGPPGCALSGARIPAGRDHITLTLTPPAPALAAPVAVRLEGRAPLGGAQVTRPVIAAEDMEQAFAYHHLVPAHDLLLLVTEGRRWVPYLQPALSGPLLVPAGGAVQLQLRSWPNPMLARLQVEVAEAPTGLSLGPVTTVPGGLAVTVQCAAAGPKAGYADNLVLEVFMDQDAKRPDGSAVQRRVPLGVLPAVPFEIVAP
jgi:hypothetical protein